MKTKISIFKPPNFVHSCITGTVQADHKVDDVIKLEATVVWSEALKPYWFSPVGLGTLCLVEIKKCRKWFVKINECKSKRISRLEAAASRGIVLYPSFPRRKNKSLEFCLTGIAQ